MNCTGCRQESPSYRWRRTSGPAPSLHTGPRGDSGRDSDPGGTERGEGAYLGDPVLKVEGALKGFLRGGGRSSAPNLWLVRIK